MTIQMLIFEHLCIRLYMSSLSLYMYTYLGHFEKYSSTFTFNRTLLNRMNLLSFLVLK